MRSRPEISRKRTPRRLACEGGALVNRGLRELRPKQLDYPKAAVSLVQQVKHRGASGPAGARIVMPFRTGAEPEATVAHLQGLVEVRFEPDVMPTFLDDLERLETRVVAAFLGDGSLPTAPAHAMLARSLVAHSRTLERNLAQLLSGRAKDELGGLDPRHTIYGEPLVVEEKPGRAFPLALEDPSTRQQIKRWGTVKDTVDARPPIDPEQGFGVAAALLSPAPLSGDPARTRTRYLNVASLDVDFGSPTMDLSVARDLGEVLAPWLGELGAPGVGSFRQVYLAVPWLVIGALFVDVLAPSASRAVVQAPDMMLGWQPSLTLIEMIANAALPALFVYTGRYPMVHVVAVWQ